MKKTARIAVALLIISVMFTACDSQEKKPPPDEVTVQLKWLHQAQFAGFYAADQNGYYAEENIAVHFITGGPTVDIQATVLEGTAQFGVAGADELIMGRAAGNPVHAIAVIYRRSPAVFVAAADSGISRPDDFVGQNILVSLSHIPTLHAMMARVGIGSDQYTVVTVPYDIELFASGEIPVWDVYLTGSIDIVRQAGYNLNIIYPDNYGVHFYNDTIFATDDFIAENPDLVLRFVRATLRGWRWAVENADEAGRLALEYDPTLNAAVQVAQMEASLPLIHTGEDQIGWMRAEIWQGMHDTLLEQGVLERPIDLSTVYTMQFLEKVYE